MGRRKRELKGRERMRRNADASPPRLHAGGRNRRPLLSAPARRFGLLSRLVLLHSSTTVVHMELRARKIAKRIKRFHLDKLKARPHLCSRSRRPAPSRPALHRLRFLTGASSTELSSESVSSVMLAAAAFLVAPRAGGFFAAGATTFLAGAFFAGLPGALEVSLFIRRAGERSRKHARLLLGRRLVLALVAVVRLVELRAPSRSVRHVATSEPLGRERTSALLLAFPLLATAFFAGAFLAGALPLPLAGARPLPDEPAIESSLSSSMLSRGLALALPLPFFVAARDEEASDASSSSFSSSSSVSAALPLPLLCARSPTD